MDETSTIKVLLLKKEMKPVGVKVLTDINSARAVGFFGGVLHNYQDLNKGIDIDPLAGTIALTAFYTGMKLTISLGRSFDIVNMLFRIKALTGMRICENPRVEGFIILPRDVDDKGLTSDEVDPSMYAFRA